MGDLRTIGKGALYTFVGMALSKLMTYFWRMIIARVGPEEYGIVSLALAVTGIMYTLSILGLETGISRYIAFYQGKNDYPRMKGVIISSFKLTIPVCLLIIGTVFIFSDFISSVFFRAPDLSPLLKIMGIAVLPYLLYNIFIAALTGLKKIEYLVFLRQVVESATKLIATVILLSLGFGIIGVAAAYLITYVLVVVLSFYFLEKTFHFIRTKVAGVSMRRELLSYSIPLLVGGIISQVLSWTDILMLGYFKNAADIGIYNTAMPTAGLMLFFPAVIGALFLPTITTSYAKGLLHDIKRVYSKVAKLIVAANIPVLLIMVFFSEDLLAFLFGREYFQGGWALRFLAIGYFFYAAVTTSNSVLDMLKKTKILMFAGILSTSLNAVLNYLLIPVYGINGAAIASASSLIAGSVFSVFFSYRYMRMHPFSKSLIYLLVAGLISISIMYFGLHAIYSVIPIVPAILGISFFLLLYGVLVFRFGIVELKEVRQVIEIFNRKLFAKYSK